MMRSNGIGVQDPRVEPIGTLSLPPQEKDLTVERKVKQLAVDAMHHYGQNDLRPSRVNALSSATSKTVDPWLDIAEVYLEIWTVIKDRRSKDREWRVKQMDRLEKRINEIVSHWNKQGSGTLGSGLASGLFSIAGGAILGGGVLLGRDVKMLEGISNACSGISQVSKTAGDTHSNFTEGGRTSLDAEVQRLRTLISDLREDDGANRAIDQGLEEAIRKLQEQVEHIHRAIQSANVLGG